MSPFDFLDHWTPLDSAFAIVGTLALVWGAVALRLAAKHPAVEIRDGSSTEHVPLRTR